MSLKAPSPISRSAVRLREKIRMLELELAELEPELDRLVAAIPEVEGQAVKLHIGPRERKAASLALLLALATVGLMRAGSKTGSLDPNRQ